MKQKCQPIDRVAVEADGGTPLDQIVMREERDEMFRRLADLSPRERAALEAKHGALPGITNMSALARERGVSRQAIAKRAESAMKRLGKLTGGEVLDDR